MTLQPPPWAKAGLPGRAVAETSAGVEDVASGRVIRSRDGKVMYFSNEQDARYVADAASEFLGQNISRVFFMRKNGERQRETALAWPKGIPQVKCGVMAIEILAWLRSREAGRTKKKRVRLPAV